MHLKILEYMGNLLCLPLLYRRFHFHILPGSYTSNAPYSQTHMNQDYSLPMYHEVTLILAT